MASQGVEGICSKLYELIKIKPTLRELSLLYEANQCCETDTLEVTLQKLLSKKMTFRDTSKQDQGKTIRSKTKHQILEDFIKKIDLGFQLAENSSFEITTKPVHIDMWNINITTTLSTLQQRHNLLMKRMENIKLIERLHRYEMGILYHFIRKQTHGNFQKYMENTRNISIRTAERYMRYALIVQEFPVLLFANVNMTDLLDNIGKVSEDQLEPFQEEVSIKSEKFQTTIKPIKFVESARLNNTKIYVDEETLVQLELKVQTASRHTIIKMDEDEL